MSNIPQTLRYAIGESSSLPPAAKSLRAADLSQTISFARIVLIVGLVFLHYESFPNSAVSPFDGLDTQAHQVATFINSFVLFFMFSVVPLLSMVSGWLFFSLDRTASFGNALRSFRSRIARRFVSLYLPLVFWNGFFLAVMTAVYFLNPSHPLLDEINVSIGNASFIEYVNSVFAFTEHPIAFQFWFVRDLFVTALVSPLLWLFMKRAPWIGAIVLGASWVVGFDLWIFFRSDVVFFFYLGGLVRLYRIPVEISWRATLIFLGVYVVLVALRALAPVWVDLSVTSQIELLDIATRGLRLFGVLACWGVFQRMALTGVGRQVATFGGLAFFLHAAHYPLLAAIKISLWDFLPEETDAYMLLHYLASVVVTVVICISIGWLLAKASPSTFALMNGGRMLAREG